MISFDLNKMLDKPRILCVLPNVPERRTGGGLLLFELLTFLACRGRLAVVVPVLPHLEDDMDDARREQLLANVEWHVLRPHRTAGWAGYLSRMLAATPAEVTKFATEANRTLLADLRSKFAPTTELAVSSWATAAYPNAILAPGARLYMVNVDPDIVRYDGPSLKRKLAAAIDRPKVARLCRRVLAESARIGSISRADVPALNRLGGRDDVAYVPPLMRPRPLERVGVVRDTVLITTNFTYSQNVTSLEWFFRECWPYVDGHAKLTVTGKDDGGRLRVLCGKQPRTTYAGCLSVADLDEAFARTAVAVNPTRLGSGFQIKMLDAISRGVPLVSTAFSNKIGPSIASSDDPRELAQLINDRLLPGAVPPFDYGGFHRAAVAAWDDFLFRE